MEKINLKLISASILLLLASSLVVNGQIPTGIYTDTVQNNESKTVHQVKINGDYFIYNQYEVDPAKFIKTVGGFFKIENTSSQNTLVVQLEFNSDYENEESNVHDHYPNQIEHKKRCYRKNKASQFISCQQKRVFIANPLSHFLLVIVAVW